MKSRERPVALAVVKANSSIDEDLIVEYALANGPTYQHPRRVLIMDELPIAGPKTIGKR